MPLTRLSRDKEEILPRFQSLQENPLLANLVASSDSVLSKKRDVSDEKLNKRLKNKESAKKCRERKKQLLERKEADLKHKEMLVEKYMSEKDIDVSRLDAKKLKNELLLVILQEMNVCSSENQSIEDCLAEFKLK